MGRSIWFGNNHQTFRNRVRSCKVPRWNTVVIMGKAQKQRAGRKKLREAYEKLRGQQLEVSEQGTGLHSNNGNDAEAGNPGKALHKARELKVEKRAQKRNALMEKLETKSLGIRKQAMKKKRKSSAIKMKAFSFESLMSELGSIDKVLHAKAEKRNKRLRDFNRHQTRQRLMTEFSKKMCEVNNDPRYQADPLGAAMMFLEEKLPTARTREQVDDEWRKVQRRLEREKKKQSKSVPGN